MANCEQCFEVEVTAERLDAERPHFEQSLLQQNSALRSRIPFPSFLFKVSVVCLWAAGFLGIFFVVISPRDRYLHTLISVTSFVAAIALTKIGYARLLAFRDRGAERMVCWRARHIVDKAKQHTPFTVVYRITDHEYRAAIEKLKIDRATPAAKIGFVYAAPHLFLMFKRQTSLNWLSVMYVDNEEHRSAMLGFFEQNQISIVNLASLEN
jgi:hypothetical protein